MAIQSNFPAIRPSLLLDFANSKRLDPRITFTRASTARYYDGSTVAKAEENTLTYSQDSSQWGAFSRATRGTGITDPLGGTTATKIVQSTSGAGAWGYTFRQLINTVNGATYTYSVIAKADEKTFLILAEDTRGSDIYTWFNLSTGAVGTTGAGHTASIVNLGNGWYQCAIRVTSTTSGTKNLYIGNAESDGSTAIATASGGVIVWATQREERSAVTAYTATTTAPITNYVPQLLTAQNNVPRFDHNPTTGESLGLLIEEQRTNLALQSEAFGTTWGATRSFVTTNILVGPDGTLTADKVYENTTASNSHYVAQTISLTSGTSYTFSVYAKAGERTQVRLRVDGTAMFANAQFNLSSGVVSSGTGTITNVGNGWYRCSVTGTSDLTGSNTVAIYLLDGSGATNYTGDGYSGLYVWGAQLEAGAFATSYIQTVAASATRQADAASMTGTNFSSWYDAAEGTLYGEAIGFGAGSGGATALMQVDDGTTNNRIAIGMLNTSTTGALVTVGGSSQVGISVSFTASYNKNVFAYKVNDFAQSLNGGAVQTDTSGLIPVVSVMRIASNATSANNVCVRKLAYYPARLTNAQLQAITG